MPTFTPEDLMNMETAGEMETTFSPVPEGEYTASVEKVTSRVVGQDKDKPLFDILWKLHDISDAIKAEVGQDEPTVRQSVFLDMDDNGRLAMGKNKNVQLGRIRDALGQNTPARWNPNMMLGMRAKVRVAHRADPQTGAVYGEVKAVAALR